MHASKLVINDIFYSFFYFFCDKKKGRRNPAPSLVVGVKLVVETTCGCPIAATNTVPGAATVGTITPTNLTCRGCSAFNLQTDKILYQVCVQHVCNHG